MVDVVRRSRAVRTSAVIGGVSARAGRLAAFFRSLNIWFWAIVGLPTLLAGVYFFGIASDLYSSEVKYLVRGPSAGQSNAISALLSGAGSSAVSEDTYAVHDYLLSRDAVRRLDQEQDLRTLLSRPEGDILTRFPGYLFWREDFEALYKAYARFVSVEIDGTSGVSTLEVKAYRPEDAQRVAKALLAFSEELVNKLNDRARHDALAVFQQEVSNT